MGKMARVIISFIVALVLFSLLFAGVVFDFWIQMTLSVAGLCVMACLFDVQAFKNLFVTSSKGFLRALLLGVLSAVVLYLIFFIGNALVCRIFEAGQHDISSVYSMKQGVNVWVVAGLIAFVIGPGEEIFWRGYIQSTLEGKYGWAGVIISALAYAGVHVASGNFILVMAALVCGLFWGVLFRRYKSIWLNIVSHVVWDIAVFLVMPF